jgi:hypothetical protein
VRFLSSMTRVLRFAVVSLLALGLAVAGLLLGMAIAASLLVLAAVKGMRAQSSASRRTVGQGRDTRYAAWAKGRVDVVDVEFRAK